MKRLEHQNAELQRKSSQRKPEIDNAVNARNAAIRKLRFARKVIRDLVNENERLQGRNSSSDVEDRHELREALMEALDENTSESDTTARQSRGVATSSGSSREASGFKASTSSTEGVPDAFSPSNFGSGDSSILSVHPLGSTSRQGGSPEPAWDIHYNNPPASSPLRCGPVAYARLMERGVVKERTIGELQKLSSSSELCLRLCAFDDLAFLYDPIFLEGSSKSHILDWGVEPVNQSLEQYIGQMTNPLHVFTFPLHRKEWFYIGAHTWKVINLWAVWPTLNAKSRTKLVQKLSDRSQGQIEKQTIINALDNGELQQLCIELSGQDHWDVSAAFALRMGYKPEEM